MVKIRIRGKKKPNGGSKPARTKMKIVRTVNNSLDKAGKDWLKLLSDPCNAPLTTGCFPGLTSGMLYRTRTIVSPGPQAVDAACYFFPTGPYSSQYLPCQYVSVNSSGTLPNTVYGAGIPGLPVDSEFRCVAACMKLRYTGSELNRSGIVGTHYTNDSPLGFFGTTGGVPLTYPSVPTLLNSVQTTYRLGETQHEVRWAPSFEDGTCTNANNLLGDKSDSGAGIGILVTGYPPGACYFELTAVWEVTPNTGSGLVPAIRAPPSRNSITDVLRSIGDLAKWATDPSTMSGVYNVAKQALGAGRVLAQAGASIAALV